MLLATIGLPENLMVPSSTSKVHAQYSPGSAFNLLPDLVFSCSLYFPLPKEQAIVYKSVFAGGRIKSWIL